MLTVSQLASESKTPIATIKFYLREGVLHRGDPTAKRRAYYDASHVQRLRLIRALRARGGLGIPAIRDVCHVIDGPAASVATVIVRVIDALGSRNHPAPATNTERARARREVLALLREHDVVIRPRARAVSDLADALIGLRRVASDVTATAFAPYLDAMLALAKRDVSENAHLVTDRDSAAYAVTLSTVLWEPILLILRRIAQEHAVRTR